MLREQFLAALDPELAPLLDVLPDVDLSDPAALRPAARPEPTTLAGTVPVRLYETDDRPRPSSALVWLHGGGFVIGSIDDADAACRRWAEAYHCLVMAVDYRLAPESPYPAALEDCYEALRWLRATAHERGVDPARIVVAGASAGGGLAAATALLARDRGEVALRAQHLWYPMLDDRGDTASSRAITFPNVWHGRANQQGWDAYLSGLAPDERPVHAVPGRATVDDLRGLPPAYIDVGTLDPLRDEDIDYARRLLAAGVPCELHVTPGVFHASEALAPHAASSKRINAARADALRRALG